MTVNCSKEGTKVYVFALWPWPRYSRQAYWDLSQLVGARVREVTCCIRSIHGICVSSCFVPKPEFAPDFIIAAVGVSGLVTCA